MNLCKTIVVRCLSQRLELAVSKLAGANKTLSLLLEDGLDLSGVLLGVELAGEGSELLVVDLGDDGIDIVESSVDLGRRSVARGVEVVGILDGTANNTLVLLGRVLGCLLCLLTLNLLCLLSSLLLGGEASLLLLGLGSLLSKALLLSLLIETALVLLGVLLLTELLDALVERQSVVDHVPQTSSVLGLLLAAGSRVLALDVALLVTVLVVIGDILVEVLKGPPAVEVVPEVVEVLDLLLGALVVAKLGDGLDVGETALSLEDFTPQLVEVALLCFLLGRGLDLSGLVDGVELPAADGVGKDLVSLLDALEELVVLGGTGSSLLVGVVLEDLPAVGALDLLLGGTVTVAGYAEDGVVVLRLGSVSVRSGDMMETETYLPVLGLGLQQHLVLGLVNVIGVLLLDVLDVGLGLDALILRECALVTLLYGVLATAPWIDKFCGDILCGHKPGSAGQQAQCCGRWPG
jgi:hypothetical protein